MSIYVACRCGQAFSAPPQLAGQTLPCPSCQQPLTVPAQAAAPAASLTPAQAPVAASVAAPGADLFGAGVAPSLGGMGVGGAVHDPFGMSPGGFGAPATGAPGLGGPGMAGDPFAAGVNMNMGVGMAAARPAQPQILPDDESPLIFWLSIIGGGLALCTVIGLLIYNATRKPTPQVASSPAAAATTPAGGTPAAVPATPAVAMPGPMPAGLHMTPPMATATPMATGPTFRPPADGQMVATGDGKYEVWMPAQPMTQTRSIPGGTMTSAQAKSTKYPGNTYAVLVTSLPNAAGQQEDFHKGLRQGLSQLGAGNISERKVQFFGHNATELEITVQVLGVNVTSKLLTFFEGTTAYTLQTAMANGRGPEEAKAFWDSFGKRGSAGPPLSATATPMPIPGAIPGSPMPGAIPGSPMPIPGTIPGTATPMTTFPGGAVPMPGAIPGGAIPMPGTIPGTATPATTIPGTVPMPGAIPGTATLPGGSAALPSPMPTFPVGTVAQNGPAGAPAAVATPAGGKRHTSKSGEFEIWFPGQPQEVATPSEFFSTGDTTSMAYLDDDGNMYSLLEVPAESGGAASLDELLKRIPQIPGAAAPKRIKVGGFDALEITAEQGFGGIDKSIRTVTVLTGKTMFALMFMGSADKLDSEEAKAFFGSLKKK